MRKSSQTSKHGSKKTRRTEQSHLLRFRRQKTKDKEDGYGAEQHTVTQGIMGFLVDAFQNVLNDKDPENGLHKVLKHAIRREAMTGLIKIADRLLKKSDKKSENGSEEGKEADHE